MRHVDAIVVGAGVMGSATAWNLARAGRTVVVLEQFEVGHRRGSSHGASRVFRLSYEDPLYVRMAQEALPLWHELEADAGEALLETTGGVDIGEMALGNTAALEAMGAACERLTAAEAAERFPMFSFPPDCPVVFQPDAGIIRADRAVRAFLSLATEAGADLRERTPVLELRLGDDRVEVRTEGETYRAPVAVVTAGAWARPILAGAGIDLPVVPTRETAACFRLEGPMPVLVQWEAIPFYALPDPGRGIKAARHHAGPEADPDEDGEVSAESVDLLSAWVGERILAADPEPWSAETCLYTNTDDERFVLKRHGPVVVGSPCSGHGFKFAPLIGKRLADLALAPST